MKVSTRPYEESHFIALGNSPLAHRMGGPLNENCHAVTLFIYDSPALIMGINNPHNGLLEIFLLPGDLFYKYPISMVKEAIKWYNHIQSEFHWRRIQAIVRDDVPIHCKFSEWLGLNHEATLYRYGPDGETVRIYSKVR